MSTDIFEKPEGWLSTGAVARTAGQSSRGLRVAAGVVLAVLATLACGYLIGSRDVGPMQTQIEALRAQLTDVQARVSALAVQASQATPPPACTPASAWLETITIQERAAQWQVAATNAQTALSSPGLCPGDRKVLAEKAIADGLEALFGERFAPEDVAAQHAAVERYQSLSRLAQEHAVPIPSARQVADRAYQVGQFLLAKVAFEEALERGEVTATDQGQVQFYYSTLYNLGTWWAKAAHGATRAEGLGLLAAANAIDRRYQIGNGLAWAKLRELLGPDERQWPRPAASPLLEGAK